MVCVLTKLRIADNSGAKIVQCIKLLGGALPRRAGPGQLIIVVIKRSNPLKKKFPVGGIFRALIVRSRAVFYRGCGVWIRFGDNACILVNRRKAPKAKRLKGPFLKEVCLRYNFIGTVTQFII